MTNRKEIQSGKLLPQRDSFRKRVSQARGSFVNKVLAIYAFLFLVLLAVGLQKVIPAQLLVRDPLAITEGKFYYGLFSNIGVLAWGASVTICFFSFFLLKGLNCRLPFQPFLLASGYLTSVLLLDDFFLLHEEVFPNYLGISGKIFFGTYGIAVVLYLIRFRKIIQRTNYIIFAIAFTFLAASLLVDIMNDFGILSGLETTVLGNDRLFVVEDGTKLFGIITWLIYFAQVGLQQVKLAVLAQD